MVEVRLEDESLVFDVKGWHQLWAFKNELRIPREQVLSAKHDPSVCKGWKGWRAPGTSVPGLITAGTYHLDGERIFWDVSNAEGAVVITLNDHKFKQLIIEVEDPVAVVEMLTA